MQRAEPPGERDIEKAEPTRVDRLRAAIQYDMPASLVVFWWRFRCRRGSRSPRTLRYCPV